MDGQRSEARRYAEKVDLTIENTLLEVRRIAYTNANDFIAEDGSPVPPEEWSPAMGACVQAIKWDNGKVREVKFWSKTEALNNAMKHLGLFEQNNAQKAGKSRSLEIVFVPGPKRDSATVIEDDQQPERMKLPFRVRRDPTDS